MALVLINRGDVARERGDLERAATLYEDALALYRELGNERGVARALERLSAGRSSRTCPDSAGAESGV